MKLLALALCWLSSHAYAPLGQTPRRLVAVRAESEDRAEQIKKLNDMFYGSTTATDADSTDAASAADASNPLSDLPLWRVQWNALPGERQVYNVHVPHYTALCVAASRPPPSRCGDDDGSWRVLPCRHAIAAADPSRAQVREISKGSEALVFRPYTITGRLGQFKDPEVQPKGRPRGHDARDRDGVPRRRAKD